MKKITSILTAALILFALTACNNGTDPNNSQEENNEYSVTEDTEFAPGWYRLTSGDSKTYYYFDDTQLCTRSGNETEEYGSDIMKEPISWTDAKKLIKEEIETGYAVFEKVTENDLPIWAKTLVFEEGWYKYITTADPNPSDEYIYFVLVDSTQTWIRAGSKSKESTAKEIKDIQESSKGYLTWDNLTRQYLYNNGEPFFKITEDELPDWAKTTTVQ